MRKRLSHHPPCRMGRRLRGPRDRGDGHGRRNRVRQVRHSAPRILHDRLIRQRRPVLRGRVRRLRIRVHPHSGDADLLRDRQGGGLHQRHLRPGRGPERMREHERQHRLGTSQVLCRALQDGILLLRIRDPAGRSADRPDRLCRQPLFRRLRRGVHGRVRTLDQRELRRHPQGRVESARHHGHPAQHGGRGGHADFRHLRSVLPRSRLGTDGNQERRLQVRRVLRRPRQGRRARREHDNR